MIDWLSMVAPLHHSTPITGGQVVSIEPTGEIAWTCNKRFTIEGSFATGLQVRTAEHESADPCTHIEVSGNPAKFFQGHNLWGTDDVHALAVATMQHIAQALNVAPTEADLRHWAIGAIRLTRIDVTDSFHLPNRASVLAWLRAAEQTAHLSHRGRGQLVKGSTLYFGKNSRRWSLKLYSKGQEVNAKGHGQDAILSLPSALEWADKTLRAELTLRGLELKRRGLSMVSDWGNLDGVDCGVTGELLRSALGNMTMTTTSELDAEVLESLRPALRMAYRAWQAGEDLRATLPHRTFYRYRAVLLPLGIDIATVMPKEVSNVVPLLRVLEAVPAGVPEWAIGTPLYFEPRRLKIA